MKTVWINGCFDILHRGHFEMFKFAKALGNFLVVGIDADNKVKNDKGADRPYNCQEDRKFALECVRYIDKVVIFHTRKELEMMIEGLSPDIMIVGSDWRGKEIVGQKHAKQLEFFERIGHYSTTNILKGIK